MTRTKTVSLSLQFPAAWVPFVRQAAFLNGMAVTAYLRSVIVADPVFREVRIASGRRFRPLRVWKPQPTKPVVMTYALEPIAPLGFWGSFANDAADIDPTP
jgi:hypothetical protein